MPNKYAFWLKAAAIAQIVTAAAHSLSFVVETPPANETEKQLVDLMTTYRMDAGAGFHPTMQEITWALSACFPLFYLLGAATIWFLLREKASPQLVKGMTVIQVFLFGIGFGLMAWLTFLPPIVMTGLVFVLLVASLPAFPKTGQTP